MKLHRIVSGGRDGDGRCFRYQRIQNGQPPAWNPFRGPVKICCTDVGLYRDRSTRRHYAELWMYKRRQSRIC